MHTGCVFDQFTQISVFDQIKLKKKRNFEQANEEWQNKGENKENSEEVN